MTLLEMLSPAIDAKNLRLPRWLLSQIFGGAFDSGGRNKQNSQMSIPMQSAAQVPQLRTSMMPEAGQGIPPTVLMQMLQARQPMIGGGQMMGMPQATPPGPGQGMPPARPQGMPGQPTAPVTTAPGAPGAGPIPDPDMMDQILEFLRRNPQFLTGMGQRMDMEANMPRQQTMPMQAPGQLPPFILSLLAGRRMR